MKNFKLKFNNGASFYCNSLNLDQAYIKVIAYMERYELTKTTITCESGAVRTVEQTGAWHWSHNGYTFNN